MDLSELLDLWISLPAYWRLSFYGSRTRLQVARTVAQDRMVWPRHGYRRSVESEGGPLRICGRSWRPWVRAGSRDTLAD